MRSFVLLTLCLSACVADVDPTEAAPELLAVEAAPPVAPFEIAVALDPNLPQRAMVAPVPPGTSVTIVAALGSGGAGPCPSVLGGECLELGGNVRVLGTAVANADGYAELPLTTPSRLTNQAITLQAVVLSTAGPLISPSVTGYVGPAFCNFQYDPQCGYDGMTYGNDCVAAVSGAVVESPGPC